ncbi:uncharacterized protein LOC102806989 [Saccoglossus kowalevskii]|uniref:Uncharacterized protein LOC102806989 n=1 Tax=Saccoglossus kowalevskii TaxID=10224 RepID=A0ABM0MAB8_SACKO|nr:PREDICTED: uncharacterized protein LOC102806989 [Saccoglossus kowalevskii]
MATRFCDIAPSLRVALWAHGRSRSTAFELAIAAEPSIKVFHEQFVMAGFHGEERMCKDVFVRGPPVPGYTYQEVKDRLEKTSCPEKSAIFIKDNAGSIGGRANYIYLPTGYIHTFLIRDPKASIISSYKSVLEDCSRIECDIRDVPKRTIEVYSFEANYILYKYITDELNLPAIIVESDDLIRNPRETLQKYCLATGLSFSENFLNWKPGNIHHFPDHMKNPQFVELYFKPAIESSCFQSPTQSPMTLSELPDELKQYIDHVMPLYREMADKKL